MPSSIGLILYFQDILSKVIQLGSDINKGDGSLSKGTVKRTLTNKVAEVTKITKSGHRSRRIWSKKSLNLVTKTTKSGH